jgi:hypothetical protein
MPTKEKFASREQIFLVENGLELPIVETTQ